MSTLIETDLDWKRRIIGLDAPDLSPAGTHTLARTRANASQ